MMDLWNETTAELATIVEETESLTVDQRIQIAQAHALLSVAEEISALNPQNTTTRGPDGRIRNGWGFPTGD